MPGKRYFCSQSIVVKSFYLLLCLLWHVCSSAQEVTDTVPPERDTAHVHIILPHKPQDAAVSAIVKHDSTQVPSKDSIVRVKTTPKQNYITLLRTHPYFNFFGTPRSEVVVNRSGQGREALFYLLVGILLYFAFIKLIFRKYLNSLFAFFFKASMRQKQIREHLMHSPVPALLLNIFSVISGGIFISFVLLYHRFHITTTMWRLMLLSILALSLIYLAKLITLKIVGWIFSIKEAVSTYIFVVYSINKLIGIFLIPFVVLLAFSERSVAQLLITLSFIMIVILFLYRYIVAYVPVRKEIKVSQFHFVLYICAFELMPLLLIYKVLIDFLERST